MVGLRDLAHAFPDVRILAISRDTTVESSDLERKIAADGRGELHVSLLSDPHSNVIDRYGLRDPAYAKQKTDGVPRPAVFVLDQQGRVRWFRIEEDYRVRPSTEEISAALDAFD